MSLSRLVPAALLSLMLATLIAPPAPATPVARTVLAEEFGFST